MSHFLAVPVLLLAGGVVTASGARLLVALARGTPLLAPCGDPAGLGAVALAVVATVAQQEQEPATTTWTLE